MAKKPPSGSSVTEGMFWLGAFCELTWNWALGTPAALTRQPECSSSCHSPRTSCSSRRQRSRRGCRQSPAGLRRRHSRWWSALRERCSAAVRCRPLRRSSHRPDCAPRSRWTSPVDGIKALEDDQRASVPTRRPSRTAGCLSVVVLTITGSASGFPLASHRRSKISAPTNPPMPPTPKRGSAGPARRP